MPIYKLVDELIFPPVSEAEDGIVAVGGDLSPERLMMAYRSGIFPWYSAEEPIIWWSPDPRCVLFPDRLHISRSMRRVLNSKRFTVTFNKNFEAVIEHCKKIYRKGQEGSWITAEMKKAYVKLHELGYAKSIEVWENEQLVGGMYGVDLGTVFCGESMFSIVSNASKVAMIVFMEKFQEEGGRLLDCQVYNDHLASMGAEEISRDEFLLFVETA